MYQRTPEEEEDDAVDIKTTKELGTWLGSRRYSYYVMCIKLKEPYSNFY